MVIEAICPSCNKTVIARRDQLGSLVVCKACSAECYVPSDRVDPGKVIGPYTTIRPLGIGASGEVHLARDNETGEQIALKILFLDELEDEIDLQRFLREARNSADLDHPGIIKIFNAEQYDNYYCLAMEFVDGEPLEKLLEKHGALAETDALRICRDVAEALEYAWDMKDLLHRDIKPANIMLSYDGSAKLMDLGIAKSLAKDVTKLTGPDTILGTPFYMSPEQCAPGKQIDSRSDMYSLGATLFHLLTEEPPYFGDTAMEVIRKHLLSPVPDAREINSDVSNETAQLIKKMMAKSANSRFKNWPDLINALNTRLG
jgi:serine/threonine-protein kinase